MNRLSIETQTQVIAALVEGSSIRSVERMTGVHRDTVMRLGVRVGQACEDAMDGLLRNLHCRRMEVDEVWTYVGKKDRHVTREDDQSQVGSFWTWVAIDADTKIVPCWLVSKRDAFAAEEFMTDLASRVRNRPQLNTDGLRLYVEAVEKAFGRNVDWATVVKSYEAEPVGEGRYSPPKVSSVEKTRMAGNPKMREASTSYIERSNLDLRMSQRRFTRLTNAFSKKPENLAAAVSLHYTYHNMVRRHGTLKTTPAVAAGVVRHPWTVRDLVELAA